MEGCFGSWTFCVGWATDALPLEDGRRTGLAFAAAAHRRHSVLARTSQMLLFALVHQPNSPRRIGNISSEALSLDRVQLQECSSRNKETLWQLTAAD